MIRWYNARELVDLHVPMKFRSVGLRTPQLWMIKEICKLKRIRRTEERHWRKTAITIHRQFYKQKYERVKEPVKAIKAIYFNKDIDECAGDQTLLSRLVDKLLGRGKENTLPKSIDAKTPSETLNDFFII